MKEFIYNVFFHLFVYLNKIFAKMWKLTVKQTITNIIPYLAQIRFLFHVFQFEKFGKHCSLGSNFIVHGSPKIVLGNKVTLRNNIQIGGSGTLMT